MWAILEAFLVRFFPALARFALKWLGPMIVQALLFFGISFATTKFAVGPLITWAQNEMSGAPQVMLEAFGMLKVDIAFSLIFSAVAAKLTSKFIFKVAAPAASS